MPIKILAVESATEACSVALSINGLIVEQFAIAPRQQSNIILNQVDRVLNDSNINLSVVDAIAYSSGPGSFMGVRLGLGVAQGLGFGLNKPLIPVSTLQILAQTAYQTADVQQVLAGWDARMGQIYWGRYALNAGIMQPLQKDQLTLPAEIDCVVDRSYTMVGNAWSVYKDQILMPHSEDVLSEIYPHAAAAAAIAAYYFQNGRHMCQASAAEPVYLRHAVADKPLLP